jgi:hypothetical protein
MKDINIFDAILNKPATDNNLFYNKIVYNRSIKYPKISTFHQAVPTPKNHEFLCTKFAIFFFVKDGQLPKFKKSWKNFKK